MKKIFSLLTILTCIVCINACKKDNAAPVQSNKPKTLGAPGSVITIDTLRSSFAYNDTSITVADYKITGIVISDVTSNNLPAGYVIIQNNNRGITLGLDAATAATFSLGDSLLVDINGATLTNANGTSILKGLASSKITTVGKGKTVAPVVIGLDKLSVNFAKYEATLVKVVNANIYPVPLATDVYKGQKFLSDASGQSTVRLFTEATASFANTTVPAIATFIGIPTWYNENAENSNVWADKQLRIRNMSDVKAVAIITAWQFGAPASAGNEVTYAATTTDPALNTSVLSRGAGLGITGSTLARGYTSNAAILMASKSDAITKSGYFQFTISAKNPASVISLQSIGARLRRSSTGANVYRWSYSLDGTTFTDIGSADISFTSTDDGVDQAPIDLSGISALQNVPGNVTITIRIYAWGFGNTGSGTFAIGRYAAGVTTNSLAVTGIVQ